MQSAHEALGVSSHAALPACSESRWRGRAIARRSGAASLLHRVRAIPHGRGNHVRTVRSGAALIAAAILVGAAPRVGAEAGRRVMVAEFGGPSPSSKVARKVVLEIVSDFYEVVPYSKYRVARRRLDITQDSMKSVAAVARKVGADAIVEGQLAGRVLTVSVREGRTGRMIDHFKVRVQGRGGSDATREEIIDELVDLIDWTEPIGGGDAEPGTGAQAAVSPGDEETRRAALAPAAKKPAAIPRTWSVDDRPAVAKPVDRRPPAIQVRGAVGVAATARKLAFSHQPDLAEDERPLGMSGSPSAGVAFTGTFDVNPLGASAEIIYKRSIGASVSYPSGGQTTQLGISLSHIAARLMLRRPVSKRVTVRGGAGYHQLSFAIASRPTGLLIPDSRYAFIDAGGGARLGLRDDRLALTADLWYLHVLTAGGITDATAFGSSRFQGFGGEVGFEIQSSDSTFVRLAGSYDRIILAFNGDGAWSTDLDESSDVDVSGAADTFIGGAVMLGFRL
jgi:hypothetical protein